MPRSGKATSGPTRNSCGNITGACSQWPADFCAAKRTRPDAVQDAFRSLVRSVRFFQGQSSLSTWLHRVVVNACLMKLRSKRNRPTVSINELLPQFCEDGHHAQPAQDWTKGPLSRLDAEEVRQQVRGCIDLLPDDYRTVLLLRDVEGLDTDATAEILKTTAGNVKTRLHRARQALRSLLELKFASR